MDGAFVYTECPSDLYMASVAPLKIEIVLRLASAEGLGGTAAPGSQRWPLWTTVE